MKRNFNNLSLSQILNGNPQLIMVLIYQVLTKQYLKKVFPIYNDFVPNGSGLLKAKISQRGMKRSNFNQKMRKHSSRMHTVCLLKMVGGVCPGGCLGGCVCVSRRWVSRVCVCVRGVCLGCVSRVCVYMCVLCVYSGGVQGYVSGGCPGGVCPVCCCVLCMCVCVCSGVCVQGAVVCSGDVHIPYGPRGRDPSDQEADTPSCGQTDTCENITLSQTSFAGGNDMYYLNQSIMATICISHSIKSF